MQRVVARRFAARMTAGCATMAVGRAAPQAFSAPAATAMMTAIPTASSSAFRFCASSSSPSPAATTIEAARIPSIVESAAQPLYEGVSQAKSADDIAERCITVATEIQKRKDELGADIPIETRVQDAGMMLVAAESLTQIGLLDDAKKDCDAALEVFEQVSGPAGYYTARCLCLRSRLNALMGEREASLKDLDSIDVAKATMEDAPSLADAWLLRTFIFNGRGSLAPGPEALKHFNDALGSVNEAIQVAQVATEEAKEGKKDDKAANSNPEQSLYVALTMRATLLVDTSAALLRGRHFDEAIKALDEAETAAKSLPSFQEGDDHPALGDIDYHRAVALAGQGDHIGAAAKAAVAYRIVAKTLPHAVDKLADIKELEVNCLNATSEGTLALKELDELIMHIAQVQLRMAEQVDPRVIGLARRKALLSRLSLLDNRGEYEQIMEVFESAGLDKEITSPDVSPEGKLFAQSRRAQTLALLGRADESIRAFEELRKTAPEVVPERVPDIELSAGFVLYGAGKTEEALKVREAALAKIDAPAEGEEGEWYISAATVATAIRLKAKSTDFSAVDDMLEKARTAMNREDYCFLSAPILYDRGSHAEAAGKAREVLKAAEPTFVEKLDAESGATEGVEIPSRFVEIVPIAALQIVREQPKSAARDRAENTVTSVVAMLRKDGRVRLADAFAKDLKQLQQGTDV